MAGSFTMRVGFACRARCGVAPYAAACCGFDLCHKYILYFVFCILYFTQQPPLQSHDVLAERLVRCHGHLRGKRLRPAAQVHATKAVPKGSLLLLPRLPPTQRTTVSIMSRVSLCFFRVHSVS